MTSDFRVNIIATGSTGNCIALHYSGRIFLLEAGIPWGKIARGIQSRFASVDGVFVSHEHMDHAKEAARFIKGGCPVICTAGTARVLGLDRGYYLRTAPKGSVGNWKYMMFPAFHDAEEPAGIFLSIGDERVFFATDTYKIGVRPQGITRLVVECNYTMETLKWNIEQGNTEEFRARRVLRSHMSLENLVTWIKTIDIAALKSVHLMHLSSDNGDFEKMKKKIQEITGVPVYGME